MLSPMRTIARIAHAFALTVGPLLAAALAATVFAAEPTTRLLGLHPLLLVVALYALASLVTFAVYALDKRAAKATERFRIPERTLQGLALAGGVPGAWLAQRRLRHKTRKQPFQRHFRLIALAHPLLWAALVALRLALA